ncbi:MAG: ribosomal RNA small subunit methyltransferase A [Actinobacteria bacterium]|nr:MAG: ribosomal RNA small subunit methyltransferase A [Actinomycetota bacterium]
MLANPSKTIEVLNKYDLCLTKLYGQHFLVDANIIRKIITSSNLNKKDDVVEIGPGIGTLSDEIAPKVKSLTLVELDKHFIAPLKYTLKSYQNVKILHKDALSLDYQKLKPGPNKLISNLPYNIASPLLIKILKEAPYIKTLVVMVQKEVGARLLAKPSTKQYGALTIKINYLAKPEKMFLVSKNVFLPKPKVDSMVVKLCRIRKWKKADEQLFDLINQSFVHRRKMLKKGPYPSKRAEELSLNDYLLIYKALSR